MDRVRERGGQGVISYFVYTSVNLSCLERSEGNNFILLDQRCCEHIIVLLTLALLYYLRNLIFIKGNILKRK